MKIHLILSLMMMIVPSAVHTQWQELSTPRFRIVFEEADRYTAERVRDMAERVFETTTGLMDYEPGERIPVVLYGYTAEANGFFTSYPPHIALFVASPTGPWLGARTDWMETLFVHELVHYLHLTQPTGFFGSVRPVIGPAAPSPSLIFMPGWALEGPTVYAETALAAGGRGENPFFEIQHAAPVLEGRMYSYDQAGVSSPFAPGGRFYASGYLIVDHLLREYGEDTFNELNRHFQRWPFLGMRRAVRRTTGLSAPELWKHVVTELEDRWAYRQEIPSGDLVTPAGPGNWQLPVETDRGFVTFASGAYQVPGLYLDGAGTAEAGPVSRGDSVNPDGWQLLAPLQPTDEYSWTVDARGTTAVVAVVSRERAGTSVFSNRILPSVSNLWVLDLTDSPRGARPAPARQLTENRQLVHPRLTPDGTRLVAVEREGSYSRLVEVDRASGDVSHLIAVERGMILHPGFSPDGTMLAATVRGNGRQQIILVDMEDPHRIMAIGPETSTMAEVHMPRIVDGAHGLELWYGGAYLARPESQLLSLYRSRIQVRNGPDGRTAEIGPPELVVEDRIAAYAGFPLQPGQDSREPDVLYASYSSDGFVLRRTIAEPGTPGGAHAIPAAAAHALVAGSAVPAGASPESRTAESSRYRDVPRPILWIPTGSTAIDTDDSDTLQFTNSTAGVMLLAASNLVRHELEIQALWHIQGRQPVGSLQYIYTPGQTSLSLGFDYDLDVLALDPGEERTSNSTLSATASRTLWTRSAPGVTRSLSARLSGRYDRRLRVTLQDGVSTSAPSVVETVQTAAGVSLGSSQAGSARDRSTSTPGGTLSTTTIVLPPVLSNNDTVILNLSSATARVNPFRERRGLAGAVQLVPSLSVVSGNTSRPGQYLPYRTVDASVTASADTDADFAALGRAELRLPLPIADAAWRALGFTTSALHVYAEQALTAGSGGTAGWSLEPVAETILGAELSVLGRFNLLDVPVRAGLTARIPHATGAGNAVIGAYAGF